MPDYSQYAYQQETSNHKIEFSGEMSEFWPQYLRDLLFSILTLGLYRFWAVTRSRRYIWNHILFDGEPFEYTGTGRELFIGFLFSLSVMCLSFGILYLLFTFGMHYFSISYWHSISLYVLLIYLLAAFLVGIIIYLGHTYKMSRLQWRGIRGRQKGSSLVYGVEYFFWSMLVSVTFGIMYPSFDIARWNYEIRHKRFGNARFVSLALSGPLYFRYLAILVTGVSAFCLLSLIALPSFLSNSVETYIAFVICVTLSLGFYKAYSVPYLISCLKYKRLAMKLDVTDKEMIFLSVRNYILMTISLGLAKPLVDFWWAQFIADKLQFFGDIDLKSITQAPAEEPIFGVGLAEGFDVG